MKAKAKIEKAFPDQAEVTKTPVFEGNAAQTYKQLQEVYDCFDEVAELRDGMISCIREVSGSANSNPPEMKLDLNPVLLCNFMGLLTAYIKLHLVMGNIEDRKSILGVYGAACQLAGPVRGEPPPHWSAVTSFVTFCDEPLKALAIEFSIAEYGPLHKVVAACLSEVSDGVEMALNPERLRASGVLSLINGKDPASISVPPCDAVPMQMEIAQSSEYMSWVALCGLVFPAVIFTSEGLSKLFGLVAEETMVIGICRGQTLNIHYEGIKPLYAWFPSKGLNLPLPPKVKFKDRVKEFRATAEANCEARQRKRRLVLASELESMKHLLLQNPGLLGPKALTVLGALAAARAEVMVYWRHINVVPNKKPTQEDPYISPLLGIAAEVTAIVRKYKSVITRYHAEYLRGAHYSSLARCITTLGGLSDINRILGPDIMRRMAGLPKYLDVLIPNSGNTNNAVIPPPGVKLQEFRWDCDRLCGALCDPQAHLVSRGGPVEALLRRMAAANRSAVLVDSLPEVLTKWADIPDAYWYLNQLRADFSQCLKNHMSRYAGGYFRALGSISASFYPECPEETHLVGSVCADVSVAMAQDAAAAVQESVSLVLHRGYELENRTLPAQAALRVQTRASRSKVRRGSAAPAAAVDPYPGEESRGADNEYVIALESSQFILSSLLKGLTVGSSDDYGALVVYDTMLVPYEYARERVLEVLRTYLKLDSVKRPTITYSYFTTAISILQASGVGSCMDVDGLVRRLLYEECYNSTSHRRKGSSDSSASPAQQKQYTYLGSAIELYMDLLRRIGPGKGPDNIPGVVYVPAREGFVNTAATTAYISQRGGHQPSPEMYLDKTELKALVSLIGVKGGSALDYAILEYVADYIKAVQHLVSGSFLALTRFRTAFLQRKSDVLDDCYRSLLPAVTKLMDCLIAIGNALTLRELLKEALREVCSYTLPSLSTVVSAACDEVTAKVTSEVTASKSASESVLSSPYLTQFASLASEIGLWGTGKLSHGGPGGDRGLCGALPPLDTLDKEKWDYLPDACAIAFVAENWKKCKFLPRLGAFEGGEHMLVPAVLGLFGAVFGDVAWAPKAGAERYLEVASGTLLHMRGSTLPQYREYNFNSMVVLLDKFVEGSPAIDRTTLEAMLPYAMVHGAYLELSARGP